MQGIMLLSIALWLLAGTAFAAETVRLNYRFRAFHGPPTYTMGQNLKAKEASIENLKKQPRYNSEKPLYLTATLGNGNDAAFTFVLDESQGTGKGYDVLYADCNNNEDLTDEKPVRARNFQGRKVFGPLSLLVEVNGRLTLYHAAVEVYDWQQPPTYHLKSLGYYFGTARFGKKTYPVALVDANANGLFGNVFKGFEEDEGGDLLLVDVNDNGRFEQEYPVPKETLYCGKWIVVDGRFYELKVHPDGSSFQIAPAKVKLVALRSDYPKFRLLLANDEGILPIESMNGKAKVPEGKYRVLMWSIELRDKKGKPWRVEGRSIGSETKPPEITVSERGGVPFKLNAPLVAKVTSERIGEGEFEFRLEFRTASGEAITDISVNERRPPEPMLRIMDEQGKEVASLKFHYG